VRPPAASKVRRLFDDHGRGPKRLERHDYVRKGELGLQVELNEHVRLAVLRLPPAIEAIALFAAHYVLNRVTIGVAYRIVRLARVAHKTFGGIARRSEHTIPFRL
jgi:hypothetical protein